jgi:hypothetical protein
MHEKSGANMASNVLLLEAGEESALHPKIGEVTENRPDSVFFC